MVVVQRAASIIKLQSYFQLVIVKVRGGCRGRMRKVSFPLSLALSYVLWLSTRRSSRGQSVKECHFYIVPERGVGEG